MFANRPVQSSRPSRAYSVEGPVRPYACQASPTPLLLKPGDHSNSTSRSVSPPFTPMRISWRLIFKLFAQPDSIHNIQDALAHVSQPQPVQVGQSSSSEASQQVLLEALPPVLILHLERFLYDAATDSINKISKPVQVMPELEIPPGTGFSFISPMLAKAKNRSRLGWSRNHGTHFQEICGAGALQALWSTLPPRRVCEQRALHSRRAAPERRRW